MKRIAIMSDLHFEFNDLYYNFPKRARMYPFLQDLAKDVDAIILAGDDFAADPKKREKDFSWFCAYTGLDKYDCELFSIPGNHDFYGLEMPNDDVFYGDYLFFDDVKIAGITLWHDFWDNPLREMKTINDSKWIQNWSIDLIKEMNQRQKKLILSQEADIIVTHHCPTRLSIPDQFKNNLDAEFNHNFSNRMEEDILDMKHKPKYWIHGHTHVKMNYVFADINFICNPFGYMAYERNHINYKPVILEI